jgi:hypothetical protein
MCGVYKMAVIARFPPQSETELYLIQNFRCMPGAFRFLAAVKSVACAVRGQARSISLKRYKQEASENKLLTSSPGTQQPNLFLE